MLWESRLHARLCIFFEQFSGKWRNNFCKTDLVIVLRWFITSYVFFLVFIFFYPLYSFFFSFNFLLCSLFILSLFICRFSFFFPFSYNLFFLSIKSSFFPSILFSIVSFFVLEGFFYFLCLIKKCILMTLKLSWST